MKCQLTVLGLCLATTYLAGCTTNNTAKTDDVYATVAKTDLLNDRRVTFDKRVSHVVTFGFDSAELPFNAADVVEPHVRYLVSNPSYKIALQGHASSEASRDYNYELAKKRIKAVKQVFLELGIEPEQIVELPVGETYSNFVPQRSVLIAY